MEFQRRYEHLGSHPKLPEKPRAAFIRYGGLNNWNRVLGGFLEYFYKGTIREYDQK